LKDLDKNAGDKLPEDIEIDVESTYNETDFSNFRDYYNDVCSSKTGTDQLPYELNPPDSARTYSDVY
jgi:hypothetical protein